MRQQEMNDISYQIEENNSRHIDLSTKKHHLQEQLSLKTQMYRGVLRETECIKQKRLEKLGYIHGCYPGLNPENYEADYVTNQVAEQAKLLSDAYDYIAGLDHELRVLEDHEQGIVVELEQMNAEVQGIEHQIEILISDLKMLKVSENLYRHQIRVDTGEQDVYGEVKAIIIRYISPDSLQCISTNLKNSQWDDAYKIVSRLISSINTMQLKNEIDSDLSGPVLLVYLYAFAVYCEHKTHDTPTSRVENISRKRRHVETYEANTAKLSELNHGLFISYPDYAEALASKIITTDGYSEVVVRDMLQLTAH